MGKKLVIVESPAKAKTISRFLGSDYVVEASFGHVRDLPESAKDVPAELKKTEMGRYGVDVNDGFKPYYVVPAEKAKHVAALRKAAKDVEAVLLATDEDREGESISWHVLELLKPKKSVKVERIVFHEITPEAIREAIANPRALDENLVRAQETRRIVDRLFGYTLSPVLWQKVAPNLSAGRVQSVAVRLLVERERERMAFHPAEYWDVKAQLRTGGSGFEAVLTRIGRKRLATGKSFDPKTGLLANADRWLRQPEAEALATESLNTSPWRVIKVERSPGKESPPPPFMTSTLQQEANRKLKYPARRTMQIAQQLYEGIDLSGERVGLITYMRTDSLTLAERALDEARHVIRELYGPEYLPKQPVRYKTKSKGAQEAHEAIRPTDLSRKPQDVKRFLSPEQFALYELIWKRTIACQMLPAQVERTAVEIEVATKEGSVFYASGKSIVFPGFLRAYVEGSDDPEADLGDKEKILPEIKEGDEFFPNGQASARVAPADKVVEDAKALGHTTKPPARYTEASLVKRLEEEGIGRPSTYATIIGTIQDRGYCFKQSNELVPTFSGFGVVELLENHFGEFVDLKFTARMEEELDDIAEGTQAWQPYLQDFFFGSAAKPGLSKEVTEEKKKAIPYPRIAIGIDPASGEAILVGVGRFGPFLQKGEGERVGIPPETVPAELTVEKALALLAGKSEGPKVVGSNPATGEPVVVKKGPYGTYLETPEPGKKTPKRVTVPPAVHEDELDQAMVEKLLVFPRSLGKDQATGEEVTVNVGRYGAYLKRGETNRTLDPWDRAFTIELAEALPVFDQPVGRAARGAGAAKAPIKEFAAEGDQPALRVLTGFYGPQVTDGKTNATIPKAQDPATLSIEQARELIRARVEKGPTVKRGRKFVRKKAKG